MNAFLSMAWFGIVSRIDCIVFLISVMVIIFWYVTGHWGLNNIIGISFCIASMSTLRIPNVKIATMLLGALFLYDIFWVFYSESIFHKNVMVTVATSHTTNPIVAIAERANITIPITHELDLPLKIMYPNDGKGYSILGLGDMVIPGMMLTTFLRFDSLKGLDLRRGYFLISFLGYCLGMLSALVAVFLYQIAQPALLYLVPGTMIPTLLAAHYRGDIVELWNGPKAKREDPEAPTP
eukprot:TRINITY_DN6229_c0_g1_i1.p1 TRINITY_DN6229_c0_g1~~TRINITY_DN6229_c0_g1_i1.p1  ORF type:complete len:237 (+),score=31.13 TRINITY_DN6229_c0_g1_i1:465-1175(+)